MGGKRPGMYATNTDARVPRVKSAARILGVAAMVAPNPTTTYVEAMRQDAAARAAAELAQGIPGEYGEYREGESANAEMTPISHSGSPSHGSQPTTPMPGGFDADMNAWARRGSVSSVVSATGSEGSAVSTPAPSSDVGSEGSKLYMHAQGHGHRHGRRRREMVPSSYESSFSDGPHPHAYASPLQGYRPGQSHSAGRAQGQGQRGRSASTGERDLSGRSTSRTLAPAQVSGSALSRADSLPARSSSRHAQDSPADDARHHGQSPSHATPRRGSAGSAGRPYPSPTYSTDSYTSYHSVSAQISPSGAAGLNLSPSPAALRHPMTRLLSPDLPPRDALYLFCNFASYMRSPQEGAEGIRDNTDFGDTIRLLDFARNQAADPRRNVHILHLKYRFQTPDQGLPMTRTEKLASLGKDADYTGKYHGGGVGRTVPQPFSVVNDPVVKIDYQDNGVFNPLPAQAVFNHIAKTCQPPPRIIVVSYVCSKATENHVASIAHWAHTSAPPIYVFSPLETRVRENRPLEDGLHHAIPISMYACPLPPPAPAASPMVNLASISAADDRGGGISPNVSMASALPRTPMTARPSRSNTDPLSKIYKSPLPRRQTNEVVGKGRGKSSDRLRQAVTPLTSPPTSPMSPVSASSTSATTATLGHSPSAARFGFGGGYSNDASTVASSGASSPNSNSKPAAGRSPTSPTTAKARLTFPFPSNTTSRTSSTPGSPPSPTSPRSPTSPGAYAAYAHGLALARSRSSTTATTTTSASASQTGIYTYAPSSLSPRIYPPDPVATLSVITQDSLTDAHTGELVPDRIPLWALAPGVGVLHGSTAVSLGVRLCDFSACNLANRASGPGRGTGTRGGREAEESGDDREKDASGRSQMPESMAAQAAVQLRFSEKHDPAQAQAQVLVAGSYLDGRANGARALSMRTDAFHGEPISRPGSAVSIRSVASTLAGAAAGAGAAAARKIGILNHAPSGSGVAVHVSHEGGGMGGDRDGDGPRGHAGFAGAGAPTIHLTPPNQDPRHLSPPDMRPARPAIDTTPAATNFEGQGGADNGALQVQGGPITGSGSSWPTPKSWPTLPDKVPGWKRGRREVMEDALEEIRISAGTETANANTKVGSQDPLSIGGGYGEAEESTNASVPMVREARVGPGLQPGFRAEVRTKSDAQLAAEMARLEVGSVEWDKGDAVLFAVRFGAVNKSD